MPRVSVEAREARKEPGETVDRDTKGRRPGSPRAFDFAAFAAWLGRLAAAETHNLVHAELEASVEPREGRVEVAASLRLHALDPKAGASGVAVAFLLAPHLELSAAGLDGLPLTPVGDPAPGDALRVFGVRRGVAPGPGAEPTPRCEADHAAGREETLELETLELRYSGRLPSEWDSPAAAELAVYNLWHPLFSGALRPFTFRLILRVPPDTVPAVSGRLVPLPPELVPHGHGDAGPRTYLWESVCPTGDVAVAVGPYAVHQGRAADLILEVFALPEDYALGQALLGWAERLLPVLERWFGTLPLHDRVGLVLTPTSNWGGYTRPAHIVLPQPLAAGLLGAEDDRRRVALWLAHEMSHLWFGAVVASDTVREPWLSEGLAEFGRLVAVEAFWGAEAYRETLARYAARVAGAAHPVPMREVIVDHPEMDVLARVRGGLMLARLREVVGDAALAETLRTFVARHLAGAVTGEGLPAPRSAQGDELVSVASRVAGRDLSGFFAEYLGPEAQHVLLQRPPGHLPQDHRTGPRQRPKSEDSVL
ncbi:MAG: hypothetical protein K6U08_02045 [Firmicutes bacterium]|nr:hypothetical protein [Bacillota bacterium]